MTTARTLFAALRRGLESTRSRLSQGGSSEHIGQLMRTSRLADRLARRGHWQDALTLLEAAATRLPRPQQDPEVEFFASPELRFAQAREHFAARAREALAGALVKPLARWRVIWQRGAIALAVLAAVLLAPTAWRRLLDRDLTVGAAWRTSSTWLNPQTGTLARHRIYESLPHLFFHTSEQAEPYIDIDLGGLRTVDRVVVVNRHDCCYERARGLKLLLSVDGDRFSSIAERDPRSIFRRWDVSVSQTRARYVRLQLPGDRRILHLADVRVYGR